MIHDTLQSQGKVLPLVSVIIPMYNVQPYIKNSIRSVLNQTYQNFEIIIVDDGSTDNSARFVRELMWQDDRIRMIPIENHGQGYGRNLAFKEAKGRYVLFLDADDKIEDVTLDLAVTRLEEDESDFAVFDWCYYKPVGRDKAYVNNDSFFSENILCGEDCLKLLNISPIYTVNKLYRCSFLKENNIGYGEGHIYEDNPFWIKAVLSAEKVSLIYSPLYNVTISNTSSTKTKGETDWHSFSFIKAMEEILEIVKEYKEKLTEFYKYVIVTYLYSKFTFYYYNRTPKQYKKTFLTNFVNLMNEFGEITDYKRIGSFSYCLKYNVFSKKRKGLFMLILSMALVWKPKLKTQRDKVKSFLKKIRNKVKQIKNKILRVKPAPSPMARYGKYLKQPIYDDVILFMGFDKRYTGNSRYLFEEMLGIDNTKYKLFFVTNNPRVPLENRVAPDTDRMYRFLARAKIVIFESWIPAKYKKPAHAIWIQLWHGTPLKKMLYDSSEKYITRKNQAGRLAKFDDIKRWDYLLTDCKVAESYFKTAFLMPENKMLPFGYPRVKYLLENRHSERIKEGIKAELGIEKEKKVVLYLPTWRDYNYGLQANSPTCDMEYIIDLKRLQELLGDEYKIIYKDHTYLSFPGNVNFENYSQEETQELLLIADFLITDYSSVMFDAFAAEIPVLLYCNDFKKNEEARGVYPKMWSDLSSFNCSSVEETANRIKAYHVDEKYGNVKEKYCYKPEEMNLAKFIYQL